MIVGYDLTVPMGKPVPGMPGDSVIFGKDAMRSFLKERANKWAFQAERSESGFEHFQVRLHLIKKDRFNTLVFKTCNKDEPGFLPRGSHWSPTTTGVHLASKFNYVVKADTRIDGPWIDTDEVPEKPPLTRQLKAFLELPLRGWQVTIKDLITAVDDRHIVLVYDNVGNSGKSIFAEYLEYEELAYEIPPFRSMEDIMQCAMSGAPKNCPAYLIDMPRGMKKDNLADFYAGLEALKNGVKYDKRYSFKKHRQDRPVIVVFTNTLPQWDLMSIDRWDVRQMEKSSTDDDGVLRHASGAPDWILTRLDAVQLAADQAETAAASAAEAEAAKEQRAQDKLDAAREREDNKRKREERADRLELERQENKRERKQARLDCEAAKLAKAAKKSLV